MFLIVREELDLEGDGKVGSWKGGGNYELVC